MADSKEEGIDRQAAAVTAIAVTLILVCTIAGNLLQRLNNAYWFSSDSIFAIILGFLTSIPLCGRGGLGLDGSFETVFFLYLIPPILFESGYALNHKDFFRNFTAIILFAVFGTIISSVVLGLGLFQLAANGYFKGLDGTSPKEALMFGSLMSATDPVATLAVLGSLGVDPQLYALVFGESVLNDAVAIVLFQTFNDLPDGTALHLSAAEAGAAMGRFLGVGIGSLVMGVAFGALTSLITKRLLKHSHAHSEVTIVLSVAYLSFLAADAAGLSGLMAVFFAGIVSSHYAKHNMSLEGQRTTHNVARTLAYISETLTFVYFGYLTLPIFFPACTLDEAGRVGTPYTLDWDFIGWTLLFCFISRAANVFPLTLLVNLLKRSPRAGQTRIGTRSALMIWFSGLRGAIAFALSMTIDRPNREYIVPCVVTIVLFTNVILGQSTAPLLRLLRIPTAASSSPHAAAAAAAAAAATVHGGEDMLPAAAAGVHGGEDGDGEGGFEGDDSYVRGRLHQRWRYIDDEYIKPVLGGHLHPSRRRPAHRPAGGGGEGGAADGGAGLLRRSMSEDDSDQILDDRTSAHRPLIPVAPARAAGGISGIRGVTREAEMQQLQQERRGAGRRLEQPPPVWTEPQWSPGADGGNGDSDDGRRSRGLKALRQVSASGERRGSPGNLDFDGTAGWSPRSDEGGTRPASAGRNGTPAAGGTESECASHMRTI